MSDNGREPWFEDYAEDTDELEIEEYDITATPNDFNVMTLYSFVDSGSVKIPGFQRNFVWDIGRASKLVESLILGLPVPQLFLYEQNRNEFLVIDGQQRLMSIYYFMKQRFPRRNKRSHIRRIFDQHTSIPDSVLHDDEYFETFNLHLSEKLPNHRNKFKGLNYSTLGDYQTQLNLRPVRNIVVKQNTPSDDDSSIYEVFNRLNTGGVNLYAQEIRTSMYRSPFYDMLYRVNTDRTWRRILQSSEPDLHMRDMEFILRGFALLIDGDNYAPSMVKFLNQFSKKCESHDATRNRYLERLFLSFLKACSDLPKDAFLNKKNNRFNVALYEAVFTAVSSASFRNRKLIGERLDIEKIRYLESDDQFLSATAMGTTQTANVRKRLSRANAIIRH